MVAASLDTEVNVLAIGLDWRASTSTSVHVHCICSHPCRSSRCSGRRCRLLRVCRLSLGVDCYALSGRIRTCRMLICSCSGLCRLFEVCGDLFLGIRQVQKGRCRLDGFLKRLLCICGSVKRSHASARLRIFMLLKEQQSSRISVVAYCHP